MEDTIEPVLQKANKLNVVIYWHMHQPEYRDLKTNQFQLPWTYLHTIKDYVDMVAHIENNPKAKAVVNFAPVLLEQIQDYAKQLGDFLKKGTEFRDPLLACLAMPVVELDATKQQLLIKTCKRANREHLIDRFEPFKQLHQMAEELTEKPERLSYYSKQFFADMLCWYHLAWIGETVKISDDRIKQLVEKERDFRFDDRKVLITVISELVSGVLDRYKKLAEAGRVELSMTPASHPIVPLLLDFNSTKEAMPDAPLPQSAGYPGGEERCQWQLTEGIKTFKKHFGFAPSGCWPSEGSISEESVKLVDSMGIKWLASGETVLRNSLNASDIEADTCINKAYQFKDTDISCFFRDDGLSDLIGFKYSTWHADDAVANLVHHLEEIAQTCQDKDDAIISIILDGENAWEYYPFNGYYFLDTMYKKLSDHPDISMTTYSEYLSAHRGRENLEQIVAGSWVYGTFSTWMGEKDKNRAWDMLVDAKIAYDQVVEKKSLSKKELKKATAQLATCESSDWFWWFGESNSAESVASFDRQYRLHLSNLYHLLKLDAPDYLEQAFSFGSGAPAMGGAMLPGQQA